MSGRSEEGPSRVPGDSGQGKQIVRRQEGQTQDFQRKSSVSQVRGQETPCGTCQNLPTRGQRVPSPVFRVAVLVNGVSDTVRHVQ